MLLERKALRAQMELGRDMNRLGYALDAYKLSAVGLGRERRPLLCPEGLAFDDAACLRRLQAVFRECAPGSGAVVESAAGGEACDPAATLAARVRIPMRGQVDVHLPAAPSGAPGGPERGRAYTAQTVRWTRAFEGILRGKLAAEAREARGERLRGPPATGAGGGRAEEESGEEEDENSEEKEHVNVGLGQEQMWEVEKMLLLYATRPSGAGYQQGMHNFAAMGLLLGLETHVRCYILP